MMNMRSCSKFASVGHAGKAELSASDAAYLAEVKKRYVTPDAEKWAYLEYKKHPSTIFAHSDPKSKEFIHSERDEYADDI